MDIIGFRVARSVEADGEKGEEDGAQLRFVSKKEGEYEFDTGIVRGKLLESSPSRGLTNAVHVPSGAKLDGAYGILSYYRIFTANKRYGTAAWDWPNESKLLPDGSLQITWPICKERPFELTGVYRLSGKATLDVETIVKAAEDLSNFEVFLASYFEENFTSPYVYVRESQESGGKGNFLLAEKSSGDWQMFPRDEGIVEIIHDGRWEKEPHPVDWVIMPNMEKPICFRRGEKEKPTVVLMAPAEDCFAIASPYEGEGHYSLYLSLFGCDVKAGETVKARSRLEIITEGSEQEIVGLYEKYMKDISEK
jgi:hypothetical protein